MFSTHLKTESPRAWGAWWQIQANWSEVGRPLVPDSRAWEQSGVLRGEELQILRAPCVPGVGLGPLHALSCLTSFSHPGEARLYSGSHRVTEKINSSPGIQLWSLSPTPTSKPLHTKRQSHLLPIHRSRPGQGGASLHSTNLGWKFCFVLLGFFFAFLYFSPSTLLLIHLTNTGMWPILGSNPRSTTSKLCSLGQIT